MAAQAFGHLDVQSEGEGRTSFFIKKEAKKLFVLWVVAPAMPNPAGPEIFWFFFSKKNGFTLLKSREYR
jgi:hypothetical protein